MIATGGFFSTHALTYNINLKTSRHAPGCFMNDGNRKLHSPVKTAPYRKRNYPGHDRANSFNCIDGAADAAADGTRFLTP